MRKQKKKNINIISICFLFIGIVFMVFGIYRGEVPVMFEKSINICLECIGIG
ncbi:CD1871A family CXXC motif-containing protein [Sinanaerobacter sp. ZZT-01]|uniref:CD1871A family CXXC motif-containing protein n=1 Tax=Sinanaerobacter sp. ZZT-01 TaxID=3111540 RepID=UPI002D78EB84|nr:CD1871A family CXXC motif-containing protein [Sinanaerobacter sp. ZZT-01]WRR93424.1 CD1871A family CXXC motif-containing protein [Sinanaerobacter sp. ZZT-01]